MADFTEALISMGCLIMIPGSLKFLYDGFFKEILNPEYVPERFGDFLSCLVGKSCGCLKFSADLLLRIFFFILSFPCSVRRKTAPGHPGAAC